jgi:hypothetical protein
MSSSPDPPTTRRPWIERLAWAIPLACGALVGIAMRLLYSGRPGYPYQAMMKSFFLLVPLLVGAVAVFVAERARHRGWWNYFCIGASANALFVLGCLLITIEGLICAVLAVPVFFLLGGLAGLAMGAVCRWTRWPRQAMYGFAALPLLLGGVGSTFPSPEPWTRSSGAASCPPRGKQSGGTSPLPRTSDRAKSAAPGCTALEFPFPYPQ